MQKQDLLDKLSQSSKLPMLPDIAFRILELKNDPDLYAAKLTAVLGSDPVLAARLLQVANSAMFRRMRDVTELGEAVAVLGVDLAMSIATGFAIVDSLRRDEVESSDFPYDFFWRKSVLGAVAANEIYLQLNVQSRGELFVAALMQDLGMLALNSVLGERYGRLVSSSRSHFDLAELERRAFGLDHAEVTVALLQKWELPAGIIDAVRHSHALFDAVTTHGLSDIQYGVALAGVLSELWISDAPDESQFEQTIRAYLEKVGEEAYRNTLTSILDAIPGANALFNIHLLTEEQMANVA